MKKLNKSSLRFSFFHVLFFFQRQPFRFFPTYLNAALYSPDTNHRGYQFQDTMKRGETSGNFDPMEGGLDAVMQAAVCPVSIVFIIF